MHKSLTIVSVLVVIVGFSIGSWRAWHFTLPGGVSEAVNGGTIVVPLLTTRTKAVFIDHQVLEFNAEHSKVQVALKFVEARDAMTDILYGKERPVLWYPDNPTWISRINDLCMGTLHRPIVDTGDPTDCRVTMVSPLVFVTTARKAVFLRPLLSTDKPWHTMAMLAAGRIPTPWGGFRLAHPDPLDSSAGVLTLALAADECSASGSASPDIATSSSFAVFLSEIEAKSHSNYPSTFALTQQYAEDPSIADIIVTDESAAIQLVRQDSRFVVIYPQPTMNEDETVCVVNGPWATAAQLAVAREFVAYLGSERSVKDSMFYNKRPPVDEAPSELDHTFEELAPKGVERSYTSESLPSYEVMNDLAYSWSRNPASAN